MIGTKVGNYRITQEIGDGGHAFVFKGESDGSQVAIKMLKPSVADEDNLEKRFIREAEALKRLRHPYIVEFKDYVFQNGYHYLMLEYMDQGSVENLIKTMGPIPPRYAIPIFYKVLEAIIYSHEQGYIHRDLKPNNILINSEGESKLTDFGITKVVGGQNLTKKGYVLGTTLYMSPEFISQGVVSVKTDIYALGVTFYEMLTARKPFEFEREDEPLVSFARRVCQGTPTPPSAYRPIPAELERIVLKSIAQNPKDRYKSAKEFHRDLEKSFPDLVRRDIVIPSGRAMTRYVKIDELFEGDEATGATSRRGFGLESRLILGLLAAVAILLLAHLAPGFLPGALGGLSKPLLYGLGGALGVAAGVALFLLLPRRAATGDQMEWATPPQSEELDLGGVMEDFEGAEESSIPDVDLEDTIPFHEGFQKQEPFKMTEISELKAYLAVIAGPDKGRRFGLRPVSRIGRDLRLDIRPHDPEISRHHAAITFDGRGFMAEDLGSTNGTFLNEERLIGKKRLQHGDILRAGSSAMRFEYAAEVAPAS